jgi:four helix bundle protein
MEKVDKIKDFTDLIVWQEGHKLVIEIYRATKSFPKEEIYSLTDQIHRAASSITSDIAEGFGRRTHKDKLLFYYHAQGSLTELKNQLLIGRDVGYLKVDDFGVLTERANTTHKLLQGLITKSKTFLNLNS